MFPQVTVGLPSIYCLIGWLDISPSIKVSCDRRDQLPGFNHDCLEGYSPQITFKNWCLPKHLIFVWREVCCRFIWARGQEFFGSHQIRKRYLFNSNITHKVLLQTLHGFRPILGINHRRYQRILVLLLALLDFTQNAHAIQCYIGWCRHPAGPYLMIEEEAGKLQVVFGPQGDL